MKKIVCLVFALLLTFCIAGCGAEIENSQENNSQSDIVFKTPAEVVEIDFEKDDPTTDEMKFVYDDEGRIIQCYYNLEGHEIFISYTYEDETVQIYAFSDSIVAADEQISLPGQYDSSIGFSEYQGYYFKGYQFSD